MSFLLDVNLLAACVWVSHKRHVDANRWLDSLPEFFTCSVVQTGFLRVSMSPGYGANFTEAREALNDVLSLNTHHLLPDEIHAGLLPVVSHRQDVTDAHLVVFAKQHRLKLATLDDALCRKPWAVGIAINPIHPGELA